MSNNILFDFAMNVTVQVQYILSTAFCFRAFHLTAHFIKFDIIPSLIAVIFGKKNHSVKCLQNSFLQHRCEKGTFSCKFYMW